MAEATWDEHGREATSPEEIPRKGRRDVIKRVYFQLKKDRISLVAAAMAYYTLFALFPALTCLVFIYALISDPQEIIQQLSLAKQVIPEEMLRLLSKQLTSLTANTQSNLSFAAIGSPLISVYSASKGSAAMMQAMNIIYQEKEDRGFFKRTSLAMVLTLLGTVFGILAIAVVVAIPAIMQFLNLEEIFGGFIIPLSWFIMLFILSFFLSLIYRYAPNRKRAKWKWVTPGAVVAALLWAVVSLFFSWYVSNFGNYNKTYGSLSAIIVLMLWFYLSSYVILIGGLINAESEHQTKRDSTFGIEKPMGARGAKMADTLGEEA